MEFVLVMVIFGGEPHALGFSSEASCYRWTEMFNLDGQQWLGRCMSEAEYRRDFPDLPLEQGS